MSAYDNLHLIAIGISFAISFALTPLVRWCALRKGWLDHPSSEIKTHKVATPSMGGIAIFLSYTATLILLRLSTQFPTGTLHSLRGILAGAAVVFFLGIVDDLLKPQGLGFKSKFCFQALAALLLIDFDIRIHFITPSYLAKLLTLLWVVGITNALNIIDVMDGLSASQAAIAALGLLMISLPSEDLYVNFASAALAGAALGFLPWNMSSKRKIFMGDCGSLTLGFILAGVSLGTKYSEINNLGVYAPLLALFVPMYDTLFVMALRMAQGLSPFMGSKDHFALRLERMGFSRRQVVLMAGLAATLLCFCAFLVTNLPLIWAAALYVALAAAIAAISVTLAKVRMKG